MATITLDRITKRFGSTEVLHDISLSIPNGAFFSLLGPSGCGKSTLLRIVAGLERPSSGGVAFDGRPVGGQRPSARNVAMVFQSYALYPHLTARQNMALPLAMRRLTWVQRLIGLNRLLPSARRVNREIADQVARTAQVLDIAALLDRKPGQLSGGQKQRVAVGRALVRQPRAFLLDEPLSNLDAKLRVQMRAELVEVHRRFGVTMLYVTHDQVEAMTMSDRIAVMLNGRIAQCGAPETLYERPETLEVAQFVGTTPMTALTVPVDGDGRLGGPVRGLAVEPNPPGRRVTLGVRPEDAALVPPPDGHLTAALARQEYVGGGILAFARLADGAVMQVQVPAAEATATGAADGLLGIRLAAARVHLFDPLTGRRLPGRLRDAGAASAHPRIGVHG